MKEERINLKKLMISREVLILKQIKERKQIDTDSQDRCCESYEETMTERLKKKGVAYLTDGELVSVLLGREDTEFARRLLAECGGIRGLFSKEWNELWQMQSLQGADIAVILIAVEILRRHLREEMIGKNILSDPKTVIDYLNASMRDGKREVFKVIYLNKANCVIGEDDLFTGTVDETAVHPREVVKSALDRNATGLVLTHNHPSGRILPSREDQEMTRRIQSVCQPLGIKVLDHIIVGDNQYFSFNEQNLL